MKCEDIVQRMRTHAVARVQGEEVPRGCRVSLPLLEPSGDVVSVTVRQCSDSDAYYVTDGGRLNGLLFESTPARPSAADRHLVKAIAERASLQFDDETRVYYARAESNTLGYWAFEVGRTIATLASMLPPPRRRRVGRRLSTYIISRLEKELSDEGLRSLMRGPRRIPGITETQRRVDLSYQARREPLGDRKLVGDVFVIAADLRLKDPVRPAREAAMAAHDLSAIDDEPIVRIVHGVVNDDDVDNDRTERARRLIKSVASAPRIEQYSWDSKADKANFLTKIRNELSVSSVHLSAVGSSTQS